jgi:hypothetical protein
MNETVGLSNKNEPEIEHSFKMTAAGAFTDGAIEGGCKDLEPLLLTPLELWFQFIRREKKKPCLSIHIYVQNTLEKVS